MGVEDKEDVIDDLFVQQPRQEMGVFERIRFECGLVEEGRYVYSRESNGARGELLGEIQVLAGNSLSFKAICMSPHHQSTSVDKPSKRGNTKEPCYLLLAATHETLPCYRAVCSWIRRAHDEDHPTHLAQAQAVIEDAKSHRPTRAGSSTDAALGVREERIVDDDVDDHD